MSRRALILVSALGLGPALPAAAEGQRLSAAWEAAIAEGEILVLAIRADLNVIAYHDAVARLCEGFPVDVEKLSAASNDLLVAAVEGLEGDALLERHTDLLIDLGVAHGLFLTEGSLLPDTFCAEAAAARDDAEFRNFWQRARGRARLPQPAGKLRHRRPMIFVERERRAARGGRR